MEHFNHKRGLLSIPPCGVWKGLVIPARFGTIYWATRSVQRSLPALRAIVEDDKGLRVNISVRSSFSFEYEGHYYSRATTSRKTAFSWTEVQSLPLNLNSRKLLAVTGPWAKALKCLESAHVTPDIIYFYFLAVIAQRSAP